MPGRPTPWNRPSRARSWSGQDSTRFEFTNLLTAAFEVHRVVPVALFCAGENLAEPVEILFVRVRHRVRKDDVHQLRESLVGVLKLDTDVFGLERLETRLHVVEIVEEGGCLPVDGLEEDDGTLVGELTDEPIEFPPDLDFDLTRELAFNETGSFDLVVTVVDDESDEAVVALPFGIKSVDTGEDLEICEG
ncbi:hypothetical protein ACLI4U_00915 [Natrialbaceae archaeon A-CW2]|uniref:hypothetical protein n=1 Tax=Natronosalvus amylolyticus TaxID=2961994 RepID=UPI0020C97977|nr:hypothetical protein [Natronosalvus amylolyticus]